MDVPAFREQLVAVLDLIGSRDRQLHLQEIAPGTCACSELFYQWDHCYGRGPAHWDHFSEDEDATFTPDELLALAEFHLVYESVESEVPKRRPRIEEFVDSPGWMRLSAAACKALAALGAG
jgi:hypothetical protein